MIRRSLEQAKKAALSRAQRYGSARYVQVDASDKNFVIVLERPEPGRRRMFWEALPDGKLTGFVHLVDLANMSILNSKHMPDVVNDKGTRKQWVGIGWVDEGTGDLKGDETVVIYGDEDVCRQES